VDQTPNQDEWLKTYYSRLQPSYDYSLQKKDTLTHWSLTILAALLGIYYAIPADQFLHAGFRFLLATGFLVILIQFFSNSLVAYSYLRKWRYLKNRIDAYWMTNAPTIKEISSDIETYDHKGHSTVGVSEMISAQLKSGFAIILGGPAVIWIAEFFNIEECSWIHYVAFLLLGGFIIWEICSLKTYGKLQKPA